MRSSGSWTATSRHAARRSGTCASCAALREDYLRELHTRFAELDLSGVDVLLDCANGATFHVAPEIFRRLGASVSVIADEPDGRNINAGCGSTHVDALAERVVAGGHALGFAFDGDGDRVLAVDRLGQVVDGDELLALAALHLREAGRLHGDGVAVTVMTNYGFHSAMEQAGVAVAITNVGDRYVLEELRSRKLDARRRAVRPHHRDGLQPHRRRHRQCAADAGGARRRRSERAPRDGQAAPAPRQRARARPRRARAGRAMSSRRSTRRARSWRDAGGCSCAPAEPSRWCA